MSVFDSIRNALGLVPDVIQTAKAVIAAVRKPKQKEPAWRGEHSWNELVAPPVCNWCGQPRTTAALTCPNDARLPRK